MTLPKVWLGDDGIVRIDYGFHGRITLDAITSAYEQHAAISKQKLPVIVLGQRMLAVDNAAARFASSAKVCNITAAMGIVTRTVLEKHLGKMFLWYQKPPYPASMFTSEDEAVAWLKQVKDNS